MRSVIVGVLLIAAVAFANNNDQQCHTPEQFSGNYAVFMYDTSSGSIDSTRGRVTYDGANKRIRLEGQHNNMRYTVIQLFNQEKEYFITGDGSCIWSKPQMFPKYEIPSDAKGVTGGFIGLTSHNQVYVNRYAGEKYGAKYIVTAAYKRPQCMPVSGVAVAKTKIVYFSLTEVDLHVDENMFNPPAHCQHEGGRRRRDAGNILDSLKFMFF